MGREERLEVLVELDAVGREERAARDRRSASPRACLSGKGNGHSLLQLAQLGQVAHESTHLGPDLVPHGVELGSHEAVERAEEGVLDRQVLDLELSEREQHQRGRS